MIKQQQFISVLEKLLEKSQGDQVRWFVKDRGIESHRNDVYAVEFSDGSQIAVEYWSPEVEPDIATAKLYVNRDVVFSETAEDGGENYGLIRALYEEARRTVTGWDEVLQQIDKELSSAGEIGRPSTNEENEISW